MSTSTTFAESATPKGASCDQQTRTWVSSRLRVEILSCQVVPIPLADTAKVNLVPSYSFIYRENQELGSARKGSRPLRQLHWLKRFWSLTVGSR